MRGWGKYVLWEVYSDAKRGVIIVDETKLLGPYKAIVVNGKVTPKFWTKNGWN